MPTTNALFVLISHSSINICIDVFHPSIHPSINQNTEIEVDKTGNYTVTILNLGDKRFAFPTAA